MEFLKRLFAAPEAGEPAPAPTEFIVPPRAYVNKAVLADAGARRGMWVMCDGRLGLITGCDADGMVEVTLQKPDGTTKMELSADDKAVPALRHVTPDQLRAAYIDEIPASRHQGEDHLRSLGYLAEGEAA